jgi:hypothetical protein
MRQRLGLLLALAFTCGLTRTATAHTGPPFPIVEDRAVSGYRVSIWTDPDATDDQALGGQFWVIVHAPDGSTPPAETRINVSARPRPSGGAQSAVADRSATDSSRWFAAVRLDHEGPWSVGVDLSGPLGPAHVDADFEATYDTRPPRGMLFVYALPFVAIGFLWLKAVRGRRRYGPPPGKR